MFSGNTCAGQGVQDGEVRSHVGVSSWWISPCSGLAPESSDSVINSWPLDQTLYHQHCAGRWGAGEMAGCIRDVDPSLNPQHRLKKSHICNPSTVRDRYRKIVGAYGLPGQLQVQWRMLCWGNRADSIRTGPQHSTASSIVHAPHTFAPMYPPSLHRGSGYGF